jgi:Zn-dependent protease with chaperone function
MLRADYFDGRSTQVRKVSLSIVDGELIVAGDAVDQRVPFADVAIDERLGRAARHLRLPDGASCEVHDLDGLDALLATTAHHDGWVDRMQRQSRFVLLALIGTILVIAAAYRWGLPWIAAKGAAALPPAVGRTLAAETLKVLDGRFLLPSQLPLNRQRALLAKFQALRIPEGQSSHAVLLFRTSPQFGANAFTLPDGTIIVLDDLVTTLDDDREIMAVFAHELGHVHGRHGLQVLLRSSIVGAFWAFYIGDVSNLIAAAPAAVLQARYSRELERQADDYGAALLIHNGMSPALLADALEKLVRARPQGATGGYLASHPSTDERIRHLRAFREPE